MPLSSLSQLASAGQRYHSLWDEEGEPRDGHQTALADHKRQAKIQGAGIKKKGMRTAAVGFPEYSPSSFANYLIDLYWGVPGSRWAFARVGSSLSRLRCVSFFFVMLTVFS